MLSKNMFQLNILLFYHQSSTLIQQINNRLGLIPQFYPPHHVPLTNLPLKANRTPPQVDERTLPIQFVTPLTSSRL